MLQDYTEVIAFACLWAPPWPCSENKLGFVTDSSWNKIGLTRKEIKNRAKEKNNGKNHFLAEEKGAYEKEKMWKMLPNVSVLSGV